jgi:hypothetical protein
METKQWTTVDKSTWGPGPWQSEPDKMQWEDPTTGLPCLIHRNGMGSLCGYVGVPRGHPYYGSSYDDVPVDVHGGLTYAAKCDPGASEEHGICHVVRPGEPDDVWWFGFDCAHAGDLSPEMEANLKSLQMPSISKAWGSDRYRDVPYVIGEVTMLAHQLAGERERS